MVEEESDNQQGRSVGNGPILVAVDFSKDSEAALRWACSYADQVGAEVVVLHVVHDPADTPGSYRRSEADALRPMADVAAEMLSQFIERLGEAHPESAAFGALKTQLVSGIPETRILEVAEQDGARIIVMGSRGRTGIPHLLLGSKAERVVQRSPIPVTIVKAEAENE